MSETPDTFRDRTTKLTQAGAVVSDLTLTEVDFTAARHLDEQSWILWRAARTGDLDAFNLSATAIVRCAGEDGEWFEGMRWHNHSDCSGHDIEEAPGSGAKPTGRMRTDFGHVARIAARRAGIPSGARPVITQPRQARKVASAAQPKEDQ